MYQRLSPVASWHAMTFAPNLCISSTAKTEDYRQKSMTLPRFRLGANVATTLFPEDPHVYIQSVSFVS